MPYIMFSKHLQSLSVRDAGLAVRQLGFDGVELTTRPGGHVLPEEVGRSLPRAVAELRDVGLSVPAIVVEIHHRRQPYVEDVCRAAAEVGATLLRTSSWRYAKFGSIREQLARARGECWELEQLGREYGVRLCIHAHSGDFLSGQGAVLAQILDGRDPRYVGVSLDMGHLTVEGGVAGWRISMDLLRDYIGILAVKSFAWFRRPDPETGALGWQAKLVPLETGMTRWPEVFALLRQIGWDGVISLHSEYQGGSSWKSLDMPELLAQTGRDFAYIRQAAGRASAPANEFA